MNVADYPINFAFGATSAPYSPARPHRGDDRAAPEGTPVIVGGTQIGLVGQTGLATGPHLHLQEYNGSPANVRKPQNSFKGGTVKATSSSSDFGNYVTIQTDDGWTDAYCHLSRIDVSVGQIIGEDMIGPQSTTTLRIGHSEIGGWDLTKTHAGEFDVLFHSAWDGHDEDEFIYQQWLAGGGWRTQRVEAMTNYPIVKQENAGLTQANKNLADTNTSLAKDNSNLTAKNAELQKELDSVTGGDAIIITRKGWNGLYDYIKQWFSKNN
jgi:hypothetical protein